MRILQRILRASRSVRHVRFVFRFPSFWLVLCGLAAAGLLFASAVTVLRVNTLITDADLHYANKESTAAWEGLRRFPADWVVELGRGADDLRFREAAVLIDERKFDDALPLLLDIAQSEDRIAASYAVNLAGTILARQGKEEPDEEKQAELLGVAGRLFAAAVVLDGNNEDAKVNLELFLRSPEGQSMQPGAYMEEAEELLPGLLQPKLPGDEKGAGSDDAYFGY